MRLALLFAGVLFAGCHAGSQPVKRGQRPLTMPKSEHQLVVGVGVKNPTDPSSFPVVHTYRWGLTDNLELTNLASLGYRIPIGRRVAIRIDGGIVGYFKRRFTVDYSGDPREPNVKNETATLYGTGITASVDLGNNVHTLFSARVSGSDSSLYGRRVDQGRFAVAAIYDGFHKISIALPISSSYGLDRDNRDERTGGVTIGGFGPVVPATPIFSYVATKQLDVFVAPFVFFNVDVDIEIGASTGIDWHWD